MSRIKKTVEEFETPIELVSVLPKGKKATRRWEYQISAFLRFGKEIKISPKSNAMLHPDRYLAEYFTDTVSVNIGIGDEHTADLVMSKAAWDALQNGAIPNIMTTEEYKQKYVYTKK